MRHGPGPRARFYYINNSSIQIQIRLIPHVICSCHRLPPPESLKFFLQETVPERNPIPGAVIGIQTFGDFLGFNPHCYVLVTDGCFYGKGMFRVAPPLDLRKLEAIFRYKVFKMLLAKGRITKDLIAMLSNWRHSGFLHIPDHFLPASGVQLLDAFPDKGKGGDFDSPVAGSPDKAALIGPSHSLH